MGEMGTAPAPAGSRGGCSGDETVGTAGAGHGAGRAAEVRGPQPCPAVLAAAPGSARAPGYRDRPPRAATNSVHAYPRQERADRALWGDHRSSHTPATLDTSPSPKGQGRTLQSISSTSWDGRHCRSPETPTRSPRFLYFRISLNAV